MAKLMPAIFFGHGNPMNAVSSNAYTEAWRRIGEQTARPKAILSISAHWYVPGTAVTVSATPRTIHDFGGFPPELYQVQYPAPGEPALARRVQNLLAPLDVTLDDSWGLDHGTWSVLKHAYPAADIPVVQLSIDETKPASFHFDIGRKLAPLREEGVLIVGSGNIVHNLHTYAWGRHSRDPYDWAVRFESAARDVMLAGEFRPLVNYETLGRDALLSIPTPDHYLPLLYVLACHQKNRKHSLSSRRRRWRIYFHAVSASWIDLATNSSFQRPFTARSLIQLLFRHGENRNPCGAAVGLLRDRILHSTRHGDILHAADLVGDDTAADRVTEILLEEHLTVLGVEGDEISLRVACKDQAARCRCHRRDHRGVRVVVPQYLSGIGIDRRHMAEALGDGILISERVGRSEEWSAGFERQTFGPPEFDRGRPIDCGDVDRVDLW